MLKRFFDTRAGDAIGMVSLVLTFLMTVAAFFGSWAYAIATYGWFLGGSLGLLPAAIIAFVVLLVCQALSPLVVVLLVTAVAAVGAWFFLR